VALPPKSEVYSNIEALMNHFKLVYDGILPPPGEVYGYTEAANGELGYYIVSDGSTQPYRVRVRPPSFINLQSLDKMARGSLVADLVAIIGTIDIVLGEVDR
jgi:NADH-quinone oxidoreductase subunit D